MLTYKLWCHVVCPVLVCYVWVTSAEPAEDNLSSLNDTNLQKNFQFSLPTRVIFATATLFSFLMSAIGNSLVICIIAKQQSIKTSTNYLIMNLAVCDILTTVFMTPNAIKRIFLEGKWFGGVMGSVTCKMVQYGNSVTLYCSLLNLVAIAIDRCLAVTRPLSYKLSSKWLVNISIPVMWLISLSLPIASVSDTQLLYYDGNVWPRCEEVGNRSSWNLYLSIASMVCSFIALITLYSVISYRLWRRNIPGEMSSNQEELFIRTARKVTILMISVVVVFFVSWAPAFVFLIIFEFGNASPTLGATVMQYPLLFALSYWLMCNNSAFNPLLYFVFIESFRQGLRSACSRCRVPRFSAHKRRLEAGRELTRNVPALDIINREEGNIELTAYYRYSS
ncbi:neuropeptide SIFamide receptor-like [Stylophora pistillata]|uniref:neuropeptide SIFamide receptor-like n=1 Tax=Stylophora pistillata TaxID=50429 RepID=UPI000C038CA5|nr:neuropeptide SIFamide receptor-like [Stylophora pistillata]XP_022785703.1 neuropeptide SIFamide receptor-like [Stylophora pistillata]XP_022785704.1 neuropeptide SIFamide receptor-like [Stylophora pistillata]